MINVVEYFYQCIVVWLWLYVIEQIQLCDVVWIEIIEYYFCFCVVVVIELDFVQRFDCCCDNVLGVMGRGVQFFCGYVIVIWFINCKRGCFDEGVDMLVVLLFIV